MPNTTTNPSIGGEVATLTILKNPSISDALKLHLVEQVPATLETPIQSRDGASGSSYIFSTSNLNAMLANDDFERFNETATAVDVSILQAITQPFIELVI